MLEPLIIVVMGVIVATIVMAVMLPMFDIATMASRSDKQAEFLVRRQTMKSVMRQGAIGLATGVGGGECIGRGLLCRRRRWRTARFAR